MKINEVTARECIAEAVHALAHVERTQVEPSGPWDKANAGLIPLWFMLASTWNNQRGVVIDERSLLRVFAENLAVCCHVETTSFTAEFQAVFFEEVPELVFDNPTGVDLQDIPELLDLMDVVETSMYTALGNIRKDNIKCHSLALYGVRMTPEQKPNLYLRSICIRTKADAVFCLRYSIDRKKEANKCL